MKSISKAWKSHDFKDILLFKASFKQFQYTKHWHDELAIGIILEGREGIDYCGNKLTTGKGEVIALNPSEVHTGFTCDDLGWSYRMFYFDMDFLEDTLDNINYAGQPFIEHPIISDEYIYNALIRLHQSFENTCFTISRETLLLETLQSLYSKYGSKNNKSVKYNFDSYKNAQIRQILHDDFENKISLDYLCQLTGMKKHQIIRSFKLEFNITPHQYMIITKINQVKKLLDQNEDITEASLKCGFYDLSHMSRNFKKVFGVSPGIYKNGNSYS